jgi:hypothetical protein
VAKVEDTDHGAKALKKRLRKELPKAIVGVYGERASGKHEGGRTNGEIAAAHEFGLGTVPMRSWLRGTMAEHRQQISAALQAICVATIKGKADAPQMMAQLAQAAAGWCKERIALGIAPELSARYLPRKLAKYPGATTPLIASGQMRGSIAGELEAGKK